MDLKDKSPKYVSRAGEKLAHALTEFSYSIEGKICADLGCSTGGFTDCLLQSGATKVYAVDTAYGVLEWNLRNDNRVIVLERTNALHVELPEKVDFVSIDAGWTKQKLILPHAFSLLKDGGDIITLVKPHYEAEPEWLNGGVVQDEYLPNVMAKVKSDVAALGAVVRGESTSPITGSKGGNTEYLLWLSR